MPDRKDEPIPAVAINNVPLTASIPLTTEEPVRRPWLKSELQELNDESNLEQYPEDGTMADEDDNDNTSSSSDDEDSMTGQNKIKNIEEDSNPDKDEPTIINDDDSSFQANNIMAYLTREMNSYNEKINDEADEYEHRVKAADSEGDLLEEQDPELLRRTESNRHIPFEEVVTPPKRSNTIRGQGENIHKELLVFSNNPTVIQEPDRLRVVEYYGAGKSGVLPNAYRSKRKAKSYLVACDFSKESLYAIEWTMGTMMRDGDELHLATVANRDDNPDVVKATGLDEKGELQATSDALRMEAKKLLGQMLLFNVKLVTHALVGRIKDCLQQLLREHSYTMVICGSRGRGSVRKLLMGSVSTYLVHKSPVPVAVIRRQKKKKKVKHEVLEAHSLTESVRTGQLHVDELS